MNERAIRENVSVLLVRPLEPGNVGSVARAMKNMGLRRMKLVGDVDLSSRECRMMAMHASDILDGSTSYRSFRKAVATDHILIGTTSVRGRKRRTRVHTAREVAGIVSEYAVSQRVCLVFGPERKGLNEDQLARCHYLASIPSSSEFPTLNLAQAVMIMAYEIFVGEGGEDAGAFDLALQSEQEAMFQHIQTALIEIGFLSERNPDHIMRAIRRFLGKSDLSSRDVQIIRGIMSQMEWYARTGHRMHSEAVKKP